MRQQPSCSSMFLRKSPTHLLSFFFQAEDGIRYGHVTGVQTCALPISRFIFARSRPRPRGKKHWASPSAKGQSPRCINTWRRMASKNRCNLTAGTRQYSDGQGAEAIPTRSKEGSRQKFLRLERRGSYER